MDQVGIDRMVLLFVTIAAVITGVMFGIIPALQAATPRLSDATQGDRPHVTQRQAAAGRRCSSAKSRCR